MSEARAEAGPPGRRLALLPLDAMGRAYKRTIWIIAFGILGFGALQCAWALSIGSRQLLKDGLDWGYDVALYGIAAFVFGRGATVERLSAMAIAACMTAAARAAGHRRRRRLVS